MEKMRKSIPTQIVICVFLAYGILISFNGVQDFLFILFDRVDKVSFQYSADQILSIFTVIRGMIMLFMAFFLSKLRRWAFMLSWVFSVFMFLWTIFVFYFVNGQIDILLGLFSLILFTCLFLAKKDFAKIKQ